jgi:hypothetical protein
LFLDKYMVGWSRIVPITCPTHPPQKLVAYNYGLTQYAFYHV